MGNGVSVTESNVVEAAEAEPQRRRVGGRTRETVLPGSAAKTAAHAGSGTSGSVLNRSLRRPTFDPNANGAAHSADTPRCMHDFYTPRVPPVRPKGAMITRTMLFWNSLTPASRLNLTAAGCTPGICPFFSTRVAGMSQPRPSSIGERGWS